MSSSGKTQHFDCCIRRFESCHPSHVVASYISLAAIFLSPRTHSAAPPFRNRSRLSRLFGCKRPHDGFVSLPPCFGLLLGFQMHFCICCFLFSFLAGFEPIVHLLRSKRDIKLLQATRLALSDSATPARKKHLLLQVLFSVLFALRRVLLLRSDIRLSAE